MINEHAAAVLALLDADNGPPPLVWFDGAVPQGITPPYVVAYFADGDLRTSTPLSGESKRFMMRIYLHCVGGNQAASRVVADRGRTALLDVVPVVAGRTCFPIRREDGQPPDRDEAIGGLILSKVDVYRLESIPAS